MNESTLPQPDMPVIQAQGALPLTEALPGAEIPQPNVETMTEAAIVGFVSARDGHDPQPAETVHTKLEISPRHHQEHLDRAAFIPGIQEMTTDQQDAIGGIIELGFEAVGPTSPSYWTSAMANERVDYRTYSFPKKSNIMAHTARPGIMMDVIDRMDQSHDLAVDMHNFGAVALASEIHAGLTVSGQAPEISVPNPVYRRDLKKQIQIDVMAGSLRKGMSREVPAQAKEALAATETITGELAQLSQGTVEDAATYLKSKVADLRSGNYGSSYKSNFNMVMDGADISPFIKQLKAQKAQERGIDIDAYSWSEWLKDAGDEQLTNFSQWYGDHLKELADPEARERYIDKRKGEYLGDVEHAVQAGWLSQDFAKRAQKRLPKAKVMFFSTFGLYTNEFGGATQPRVLGSDLVALPTISSDMIDIHEFGHVVSGVDAKGMTKYFQKDLPKDERDSSGFSDDMVELYTMLNEGYNDHMTAALLEGSPEIFSPDARRTAGVQEVGGHSKGYERYREIFGELVQGSGEALEPTDVKVVADTMENFDDFASLVSQRWKGRPILNEMMKIVTGNREAAAQDRMKPPADTVEDIKHLLSRTAG